MRGRLIFSGVHGSPLTRTTDTQTGLDASKNGFAQTANRMSLNVRDIDVYSAWNGSAHTYTIPKDGLYGLYFFGKVGPSQYHLRFLLDGVFLSFPCGDPTSSPSAASQKIEARAAAVGSVQDSQLKAKGVSWKSIKGKAVHIAFPGVVPEPAYVAGVKAKEVRGFIFGMRPLAFNMFDGTNYRRGQVTVLERWLKKGQVLTIGMHGALKANTNTKTYQTPTSKSKTSKTKTKTTTTYERKTKVTGLTSHCDMTGMFITELASG